MTNDRDLQFCEDYFYISPHFLFLPFNVVEQCHEDDDALKLLWITLLFFHEFLNLFEEAKSCESCEYFHSRPIDSPSIRLKSLNMITSRNTT